LLALVLTALRQMCYYNVFHVITFHVISLHSSGTIPVLVARKSSNFCSLCLLLWLQVDTGLGRIKPYCYLCGRLLFTHL